MDSPGELEVRVRAGGELSPGQAAVLLRISRSSVDRLLQAGEIRYTRTPGGQRRCHPEDVLRILAERRRVHPVAEDQPTDPTPERAGGE